ncbi:carbonyl reductase family member 4-like isoform X1 [Leptotrombidium deliense]|uniref:3-ketoacyl-[acyl-carrier-protein] reductase beta subunit n=1 Tax=Leptotrombidium deliense TaxID=299467 RepID=A0A443SRC7_9ACAR|nr:carbonyl reductase family member 4-like isoform X1 [Leptotrombidium deliense]
MNCVKHALIFGGSRGIGLSVAQKFLNESFNVSIVSRSQNNVELALKKLRENKTNNGLISGYKCNVVNELEVAKLFKQIHECNQSVDVLVNAAGINKDSLLINCSQEVLRNITDTNLLGSMITCKHCLKTMIRQRKGTIVNIGSIIGLKGNIGQSAYAASKAGLIGFVKSLAKEVAPKGITVNIVCPGFIETDLTANVPLSNISRIPLKRLGTAEEVAECVFFLANSSFITGDVLVVDGGLSLQM